MNIEREYDIIVIGAGPGGSGAALAAAKKGMKVLLLEKRQEIGAPKRCAEGLSRSTLKRMGIEKDDKWIRREIIGATIYAPDGRRVRVDYNEGPEGYVIERKVFDKYLAVKATEAGAKILAKAEVLGLLKENGKVCGVEMEFEDERRKVRAKIVIAADGVESKLAREAGLDTTLKLVDIASGVQFEMSGIDIDPDRIEMYFGNEIAPGGYCVTPSTEIITRNTVKPITNVSLGEEVLSLKGWVPATARSIRDYEGEIVSIKQCMLNSEAKLTSDHLVYVWNRRDGFAWKKACELKKGDRGKHRDGDYLLFPIPREKKVNYIKIQDYAEGILHNGKLYPIGRNQFGAEFKYKYGIPNKLILTRELMEFFGYYVAEGNVNSNGIIISTTDQKLVQRIKIIGEKFFGVKAYLWKSKIDNRKLCVQVTFPSKILRQLFKSLFKEGCRNKTFPRFFSGLSDGLKISFLIGLYRGDGNKYKKTSTGYHNLNYTSTSKSLIYDLWMLLSTIGVIGAIGKIRKKNAYRLRVYGKQLEKLEKIFGKCKYGKLQNNRSFIRNGFVFMGIRNLERERYKGKVYDIQSKGSFCPGFIVHNCWIFPKGEKIANVGIGVRKPFAKERAIDYLKRFIESRPGLKKGSIIEVNSGGVPVGGLMENMVTDNFIVVGDAAHQANPIHGGGMGESWIGGRLAGEVATEAIKAKNCSKEFLSKYNKIWWEKRGKKLQKLVKFREVLESLSDDDLNWLTDYLKGEDLIEFARSSGFGKFAKILMKKPKLIKLARKLL